MFQNKLAENPAVRNLQLCKQGESLIIETANAEGRRGPQASQEN